MQPTNSRGMVGGRLPRLHFSFNLKGPEGKKTHLHQVQRLLLGPRGPEVSPWHPHNAPANHQPLRSSHECRGGGRWDHNTQASARPARTSGPPSVSQRRLHFPGPFQVRPKIFCNNAKSAVLLFFQVCAVEFFRGYNNEPSRPTVGAGIESNCLP